MSGVIIDTCMWSLAFRGKRPREQEVAESIANLISESRAKILGPIRQELLSGYSDMSAFKRLRDKMDAFPNEKIVDIDYEMAAEFSNRCRSKGVQGSHVDFLICAVSHRLNMKIYTNDKDFLHYSKHLPLELLEEN